MSTYNESDVTMFALKNEHGMEAKFINYGAILVSLRVPDRHGNVGEVTLGNETIYGIEIICKESTLLDLKLLNPVLNCCSTLNLSPFFKAQKNIGKRNAVN